MYDEILAFAELFEKAAGKKKKKKPWTDKPNGWDSKSVKQYARTMTKGKKHPFTSCVEKMKGKVKDPKPFCGSVKNIAKKNKV